MPRMPSSSRKPPVGAALPIELNAAISPTNSAAPMYAAVEAFTVAARLKPRAPLDARLGDALEREPSGERSRSPDRRFDSLQRFLRVGFDRRPFLHQLIEPFVGARADFLIGAADLASDVRHLVDEHLVFVRTGLRRQPGPDGLQRGLIPALRVDCLPDPLRELPRLGQRVADLERELRMLREIGGGNAVGRNAWIDLHRERLGLRDAAGGEARLVRTRRDERPVAAEAAAFAVAAARGSARMAQIPHEPV